MTGETGAGADLSMTAAWTAAVRAAESRRDDRLFFDPWAETLAGPEGEAWLAKRDPQSTVPIILRTRFFDDLVLKAVAEEGIRQLVLLGAGYDTRAYRLDLPETMRVYEVDRADVLTRKQRLLDEAGAQLKCERIPVAADVTGDWEAPLTAAGLVAGEAAIWLLEGFLFYLPSRKVSDLLARIDATAAGGSWIGFDAINELVLTSPFTRSWVEMQAAEGAPWLGTFDNPEKHLKRRGWRPQVTQFGEEGADHGRWQGPVVDRDVPDVPRFWLVSARRPYTFRAVTGEAAAQGDLGGQVPGGMGGQVPSGAGGQLPGGMGGPGCGPGCGVPGPGQPGPGQPGTGVPGMGPHQIGRAHV